MRWARLPVGHSNDSERAGDSDNVERCALADCQQASAQACSGLQGRIGARAAIYTQCDLNIRTLRLAVCTLPTLSLSLDLSLGCFARSVSCLLSHCRSWDQFTVLRKAIKAARLLSASNSRLLGCPGTPKIGVWVFARSRRLWAPASPMRLYYVTSLN
jgi:hypothetical protein